MFDFGWQEFVMVAFVLVLVVGPKDLPKVLRGFTKFTRQARQMAREFTQSLEEAGADDNIRDVKSMVADLKSGNLEDMARIVDDKDVTSELSKIKEDVDIASIGSEVKKVQRAGAEDACDPVPVLKVAAPKVAAPKVAVKKAGKKTASPKSAKTKPPKKSVSTKSNKVQGA